jgi:precorrin-6B methylase 1
MFVYFRWVFRQTYVVVMHRPKPKQTLVPTSDDKEPTLLQDQRSCNANEKANAFAALLVLPNHRSTIHTTFENLGSSDVRMM